MKVLLAHDGSSAADDALVDMTRAGLGSDVACEVLCVAEALPATLALATGMALAPSTEMRALEDSALADARRSASAVAERVRAAFPSWRVTATGVAGSPSWEIMKRAEAGSVDLIILGARGHSAVVGHLLGSVSESVARHARCAVRVARPSLGRLPFVSLVVGMDGSHAAWPVLAAVAARTWPSETRVHVVTVVDRALRTRLAGGDEERGMRCGRDVAQAAARELEGRGLRVSTEAVQGDARVELLRAIVEQTADAIFVGARGLTGVERLLLGSVSSALLARAPCSVEIVRH